MQHLVEDHSVVDPTYIEDFLLTYRTFLPSPLILGQRLLDWFNDPSLRDKVGGLNLSSFGWEHTQLVFALLHSFAHSLLLR